MFEKLKINNRSAYFYLFILFWSVYTLTGAAIVGYTDVGNRRIEVLESIFSNFDVNIQPGRGVKGVDGREYSPFFIGSVFVAVPFYAMAKMAHISPFDTISVMNRLAATGTAILVFAFIRSLGYSKRTSIYVSIIYGLGSIAWYYSKDPGDHSLETFFVLFSVYLMYKHFSGQEFYYFIFSLITFGFAFITRASSILVLPSLFVLSFGQMWSKNSFSIETGLKKLATFILVFMPFLILIFWYNFYRFGSIFETGHSLMGERFGIDFFSGTPILTGIKGFLVSPGKGMFFYSPVAILFFFSVKPFFKRNYFLTLSFLLIIVFYLMFMSKNIFWHGDWSWGPRYLFVITPYLIIPIASLIESEIWAKKKFMRYFVFLLFLISVGIQLVSVSIWNYNYFYSLHIDEKVDFVVAKGEGAVSIYEPPTENYFYWSRSPIIYNFKNIVKIIKDISQGKIIEKYSEKTFLKKIRNDRRYNLLDFWWFEMYIKNNNRLVLLVPMFFLSLAGYSFFILCKIK